MFISLFRKLMLLMALAIIAVGVMIIYFRSRNVTRSEFFKYFKNVNYIKARVIIFVLIVTGIFGIFNHYDAKNVIQAVISLNYSEASRALNSNGTRYNMAEITSDEVIKRAIEKGAFENVSVKDLKNCLWVSPYVQGDAYNEDNYHISTEFVVGYQASKRTRHLDPENVVNMVTSAYKEYYIEHYTDNFRMDTKEEKPDFSKTEYMDIVSYFQKETSAILNYLYGMAEKGSGFVTENNTTFNSIAGKVFQFKETQIEQNLRSLILQHGVARNKEGYIDRLSYQNTNTDFDRRKNAASFDLCNRAIAMYSEEMTRVVLVPTWDQSGKYYMGRTKVGIDELSVKAKEFSEQVASSEKEIMDNNLIIGKMQGVPGNGTSQDAVDELVASIDESIKQFADEAIAAGREFSNNRMNQCMAVSISGASLISELKTVILFMLLSYMAVMLWVISKKIPKKSNGR